MILYLEGWFPATLQILSFLLRCETSKIMPFFAFKRNEIFASISIFASEAKMRAHPTTVEDTGIGTERTQIGFSECVCRAMTR